MTLRRRLALRYAGLVAVCLLLLAGLAHHEFILEPARRRQLGLPAMPENLWIEFAEVFFYSMIPVTLGIGWWLMRRTLTPIDTLAASVERIRADNLHEPLPRTGTGDEVDRLAETFNAMTARLDESFRQVRDFTLNASHELKTPLTVMRAELETALAENAHVPAEKQEWIHRQLDEVQRLTNIVDALTLLAKADAGQVPLELRPVRLGELVGECFEDAQVLAEPHGVKVTLLDWDDLTIHGDRHRLRQLLLNLVDNAIKYNVRGGTVTLSLQREGLAAVLEIVNTGKGVPPEQQAHIFERFVRGDNARLSGVEGSGLGLAIVQWIVHAHGGTITLGSVPGATTTVRVTLPLPAPTAV
jgi:signal transduction histidine kinase